MKNVPGAPAQKETESLARRSLLSAGKRLQPLDEKGRVVPSKTDVFFDALPARQRLQPLDEKGRVVPSKKDVFFDALESLDDLESEDEHYEDAQQ